MPDVAMTHVVFALFAQGSTTIRDVASWRVKETERMIAICTEHRKMEKSDDFSVPPAACGSPHLPTNSGVTIENCASPHAVRVFPSDKSDHIHVASGSFQTALPFGHATNSSSLPYQLPTSEVRPMDVENN